MCSSDQAGKGKEEENKAKDLGMLRIGVMSAADSAPILLAEENGYFEELGLNVELEIFTNGATKQSSIQAGELDGAKIGRSSCWERVCQYLCVTLVSCLYLTTNKNMHTHINSVYRLDLFTLSHLCAIPSETYVCEKKHPLIPQLILWLSLIDL